MRTQLILKKRSILGAWSGVSTPDVPTGWTLNDDGSLTHTPGAADTLEQDILQPTLTYRVTLNITGRTAGSLTINAGVGFGNQTSGAISTNGVSEWDLRAGGSTTFNGTRFQLVASSTFDGTVQWIITTFSPGTYNVDLKEDSQFPITYNIADIREPAKRNTSFSKTITLPGTDNNNQILGHLYEIEQDGTFNPNKFTSAVVLQDGVEVFSGVMQVVGISRILNGFGNYDSIEYQVNLLGRLTDIFLELGDSKLTDLDFTEWDHIYNRDNEADSWNGAVILNGIPYNNYTSGPVVTFSTISPNGSGSQTRVELNCTGPHGLAVGEQLLLFGIALEISNPQLLGYNVVHEVTGPNDVVIETSWNDLVITTANGSVKTHVPKGEGYVYPMIDYGSVGLQADTWKVEDLRPAIYLKEYIDKMFGFAQYSYTSNFFNSSYFKRLIIPSNTEKFTLTPTQIADRMFRAGMPDYVGYYQATKIGSPSTHSPSHIGGTGTLVLPFDNDSTNGNYDGNNPLSPQTNYDVTLYEFTAPQSGYYDIGLNGNITHNLMFPWFYNNLVGPIFVVGDIITLTTGAGAGSTAEVVIVGSFSGNPALVLRLLTSVGSGWNGIVVGDTWDNGTGTTADFFGIAYSEGVIPSNFISVRNAFLFLTKNGLAFSTTQMAPQNNQNISSWFGVDSFTVDINGSVPITSMFPVQQADIVASVFLNAGDVVQAKAGFNANLNLVGFGTVWGGSGYIDYEVRDAHFYAAISNPIVVEGNPISLSQIVPTNVYNRDLLSSVINAFNLYVVQDPVNTRNLIIEPRDDFYVNNIVDWTLKLDVSREIQLEPMGELQGRTYLYTYKSDKDILNQTYEDIYNKRRYGDQLVEVDNDFVKNQKTVELIFSPSVLAGPSDFYYNRDFTITQIKKDYTGVPAFVQSNIRLLWFSLLGCGQSWRHISTDGTYDDNLFYPYAGHLDKPKTPVFDLNFGYPNRLWYLYNSYTSNNLYNMFHRNFIEEITDKDSKLVTAYFKLTASDILTLDFSKIYVVDGHFLRLNKVMDYDPIATGVTKCEFITVKTDTQWSKQSAIGVFPGGNIPGSWTLDTAIGVFQFPVINDGSMTYNTVPGNTRDDGNGVVINGTGNTVRGGVKSAHIWGSGNDVGQNVKNLILLGDNNIVYGGLQNIAIINTSGVTVTQSNVSWINGIFYPSGSGGTPAVIVPFTIITTDATPVTAASFSMDDDQCASVEVVVSCMGLSSANDAASFKSYSSFYKRAGTVTQIGTEDKSSKAKSDQGIRTNANNPDGVAFLVQGLAATTLVWNGTLTYQISQA